MSWTDGEPFTVTEEQIQQNWDGANRGKYSRCGLCGHKFKAGEIARWQYTNDTPGAGGNPLVCQSCAGPKEEIVAKWKAMHEEAQGRMWWFCRKD